MNREFKDKIKKTFTGGNNPSGGFSLLEVLLAITILTTSVVFILQGAASMSETMAEARVRRTANECARMAQEYFTTIPPDVLYTNTSGTATEGDFSTNGKFPGLNAFMDTASDTCSKLSSGKSKLKYNICPGCVSFSTEIDPVSGATFTTCKYFFRLKFTYQGVSKAALREVKMPVVQKYEGRASACDVSTVAGLSVCGAGSTGADTVRNCTY